MTQLTTRPKAWRLIAIAAGAAGFAVLAGCTPPPPPVGQARADQLAQQACRQQADQTYERQNRGAVYTSYDNRDTPRSGGYTYGDTTRNLGALYSRDQSIADCLRSSGPESITPPLPAVGPVAH